MILLANELVTKHSDTASLEASKWPTLQVNG